MFSKSQMVVFIIMELSPRELLVSIVLPLKNGLKIKAPFVGVEDYLSIKIMFLLEDILVLAFYGTMRLIMDGHLNPQEQLTVLK